MDLLGGFRRCMLALGLAAVCLAGAGAGVTEAHSDEVVHVKPMPSDRVLYNPYIGMAPSALNGPYDLPHRLVYAYWTWRDIEPEKGKYAFEELEKKYKFEEWNQKGVQVILRIVLDYSTEESHIDIPDWLYEETGRDGIWYDAEVGKGYSPNYENPVLIARHEELIRKLGQRYNRDFRIAYIALGSLGHWGEWHTYFDDKIHIPFPKLAVSDQYVRHYTEAFPDKHLLMRRPHPVVKTEGLGLYNDMFGSHAATVESFVDWFTNGYTSVLAGADIPSMPEFWLRGPSGGEFGNADRIRSYLQKDRIDEIIRQAELSHTSWLGPSTPLGIGISPEERDNLNLLLKRMGYRFGISSVSHRKEARSGTELPVAFVINNSGVAPIYYRWPVALSLSDRSGKVVVERTVQEDIRSWFPGIKQSNMLLTIPAGIPEGEYSLCIAILNPVTRKPGIEFANEGRRQDGRYELSKITVTAFSSRSDQ